MTTCIGCGESFVREGAYQGNYCIFCRDIRYKADSERERDAETAVGDSE